MLRVKAEIYRLGAAKRQKEDEIRKIETLLREIEQNKPLSSDYRAWLDSSAVPA